MKKKTIKGKLRLDKNVISKLGAASIKGGETTIPCVVTVTLGVCTIDKTDKFQR